VTLWDFDFLFKEGIRVSLLADLELMPAMRPSPESGARQKEHVTPHPSQQDD
jgi:hypothetical protein